jgi:hypothetical protein
MSSDKTSLSIPAHQVFDAIRGVKSAKAQTLVQAWALYLSNQPGTLTFARRHAELVKLFSETLDEIDSLPEGPRNRYRIYVHAWWNALIAPDALWNNTRHPPEKIINSSNLDQLAGLGDLLEARYKVTAVPAKASLESLRVQCDEWIAILNDDKEIANESLRLTLASQLHHLIWLINNAEAFGVARIVKHADGVTGTLVRVAASGQVVNRDGQFTQRLKKFVATLAIVSGALTGVAGTIEAVDHNVKAIESLVHDVSHENGSESPGHKIP